MTLFSTHSSLPVHIYSILLQLTFIALPSKTNLHASSYSSTCSLLSLQITLSSANLIDHGESCLTSSVSLSITIASKKGLRAEPWCSPTSTLNSSVAPTAHFTNILQFSYMSCTVLCHPRLPHTIPQLLSEHPAVSYPSVDLCWTWQTNLKLAPRLLALLSFQTVSWTQILATFFICIMSPNSLPFSVIVPTSKVPTLSLWL